MFCKYLNDKCQSKLLALLSLLILLCPAASAVDWPEFMQTQDMIWKSMPIDWTEGPFLGNGWLGTMIYQNGEAKNQLRIDVQHTGVYDNEPFGGAQYGRARLPIGFFTVQSKGQITGCDLRLDLWNAEFRGSITTTKGSYDITAVIHTEDIAAMVEITPAGNENCIINFHPQKATTQRQQWKGKTQKYYKYNLP